MVTYQVRFYELAVVRTFGRISPPDADTGRSPDVQTEAGWYMRWPWPIQNVDVYDGRVHVTELVGEEIATRDSKNVILATAIQWEISDAYKLATTCGSAGQAEENLEILVRDRQKTVIGQYDLASLVSIDPESLEYDRIQERILKEVRADVAHTRYGLAVKSIGMETLTLPEQISERVFDAMSKERQNQAARYTNQGKAKADQIKAEADNIADTILTFAGAKADRIVAEGLARAAQQNEVFAQDEELAKLLLQVDNLVNMLKKRTTVVLPTDLSPFDLILEERPTKDAEEARPKEIAGDDEGGGPGAAALSPLPKIVAPE